VIAALTMTIFSALAACTLFGMELTGALVAVGYLNDDWYPYNQYAWVNIVLNNSMQYLQYCLFAIITT